MPTGQQQQRGRQGGNRSTAVATRPPEQQASQALVAVTREIDNRLAIIQASAAAGIDADRLKLVALTAFTRVPALMACEPVSVARAIVEAGQLGLEPTGLLGGAYLVPRGGKATLLVGYRGLVMLAKRSGEVQRVEARVVREKDAFDYGYGLEPLVHHKPSREADPGNLSFAYAVIVYRDGERQFDVMSRAEIEAIRKRSSSADSGPWVTDYFEMCKKTVLRRLMKLAPLTINVAQKLDELDPEVDEAPARSAQSGRQAELRQELQAALEREYGTSPGNAPATPPPAGGNGQAGTTQAGGADPTAGPTTGATSTEGASSPPAATPVAQAGAAAAVPAAAAPAAAPAPLCGITHQALGVGPCVLPKDHQPNEHQEAGGTRWTQPRGQ